MSDTVIIYEKKEACITAGFTGRKLDMLDVEEKNHIYKKGNIYIGHVVKILLHLGAAYLDIGMSKHCYMELKKGIDYLTDKEHPDGELHVGDEIAVQIEKEAGKGKPATVTPELEIDGRLVVVRYTGVKKEVCFSSKIKDKKFKKMIEAEFMPELEEKHSVLLRTNAYDADLESIKKEYVRICGTLDDLLANYKSRIKGSLIYQSAPDYVTRIRNQKTLGCEKMITDSPDIYMNLREYLKEYQPEVADRLSFYSDRVLPLENLYDMKKNFSELGSEKVWLKSGAHLVIQSTEALTVVDVNSSKSSGTKKNFVDGFLSINLEAAEEIIRQIILRNISGIVIVDFINDKDMNRPEFLQKIKEMAAVDNSITIVDFTKLGLLEMTRKRTSPPLNELVKKYGLSHY